MGVNTRESLLDGQGLLEIWASFLEDAANSFQNHATPATSGELGSLICKITNLWGVEFDSEAATSKFPAQRSQTNGSLLLPLANVWAASHTLTEILEQFGVSQDGKLLGDDGVLGEGDDTGDGTSSGLVNDIVQAFGSQPFKINTTERNGVWLTPGQALRSDVTLTLATDGPNDAALGAILTGIAQYFNIPLPSVSAQVNDFSIIIQRTRLGVRMQQDNVNTWHISKFFRITFRLVQNSFTFWLTSQPTGLSFYVTQDQTQTGNLFDLTPPPVNSIGTVIDNSIFSGIKLVQLSAGKSAGAGIWWRAILAFRLHNADAYLEYESLSQTLSGGLIVGDLRDPDDDGVVLQKGFYSSFDTKILPSYEPGKDVDPPGGVIAPLYKQTYLGDLVDQLRSLPSSIPTAIALANISYSMPDGDTPGALWFAARLIQPLNVAQPNHKVPSPFNWDVMDVSFQLVGASLQQAEIATHFTLTDVAPSDRVALLGLRFTYDSGSWELDGSVQNLSISMLWQFFDPNVKDGLLKILGKIEIAKLIVKYKYDPSGAATSFSLDGTVDIGKLGLRMTYEHTETGWKFQFKAGSDTSDGKATLQDVLNSIVDGSGNSLPSFVAGIEIPAVSGDDSAISITVQRGGDLQGSTGADNRLIFACHIDIDHFKFSMVQVTNADGSQTKRVIRFSVDKIPLIPKVPLLEKLPQPFDELEYMWVDPDGEGWKESEVKEINKDVLTGSDKLSYKPLSGTDKDGKQADGAGDVVLKTGHHFVILNKGSVVLDHVFGASGTPEPSQGDGSPPSNRLPPGDGATVASTLVSVRGQTTHRFNAISSATDASQDPSTNAPTKGAMTFSFGPLTISAIALHYKEDGGNKVLALTMDATFDLSPITFSLLGFGLGIKLDGLKLNDLSKVADHLEVELHGMSLAFNRPPLLIAGGFEHDTGPSGEEIYKGAIGVSFPPYTFIGLGEYAVFRDYKSVFIYAKLDGPLVTLGFATISGIRLGLGYNSSVRTPELEEITSFPFINDHSVSNTGNDPMAILNAMTSSSPAWVTPTKDSYWFAAGLSLVAFDILTVAAVAMVQFRDAGLIISIIADAVAQMPPSVTSRSEMIAYVELGFICELNTIDGYFRVEAALAPTSFLLVPSCHIYGGMALVYWFHPNAHAGDWVFTVGGYHRKFEKPDWYPTVQRLGISFSIGSYLKVTGETYFAITPKCAMGGALIHVTLSIGPVSAWLDAGFDALVNFHPLHYIVDFHVAVGVAFDADVWFVHIHISATVGAWLEVQGPEFGGTAHVDFCMFSFDVEFGASPQGPPPMTLPEFWGMLHKPGPNVESRNTNDENPPESLLSYIKGGQPAVQQRNEGAAFVFSLEDGNFPMPHRKDTSTNPNGGSTSTGAGSKWFVKGGSLRFRINSDFAISKATVQDTTAVTAPADAVIYSRPMHVDSPIMSELTVTVRRVIDSSVQGSWRSVVADMKLMPQAAFGKYDPKLDPSNPKADSTALLSGDPGLVNLMMGVIITTPLPILAESKIGLIQNATNMMLAGIKDFRGNVCPTGTDWLLPAWEPAQSKYLPAPLTDAEKSETNQERWDAMRTTWSALESKQNLLNGETDGLLAKCNDIFGWQKTQLQTEPPQQPPSNGTQQPWQLIGKLPTKLINSLEVRYLDLPRTAVV